MPIQQTISSLSGASYTLSDEPFARGGEGDVFKIVNSDKCIKIYRSPNINTKKKLMKMVSYPQNLPVSLPFTLCWPLDIVFLDKKFSGFVMNTAYSDSIPLYELCLPNIRKSLNGNWGTKFDRAIGLGIYNRLKICVNLASAVYAVHSSGHCIVDLKPQNILVSPDGRISLIDLDSIQFSIGEYLYNAPVSTPEYAPPEIKYINATEEKILNNWDRFSLAVIIYEVLFGIHPFAATFKPPYDNINTIGGKIKEGLYVHGNNKSDLLACSFTHGNLQELPAEVSTLFYRAFVKGHKKPSERPSAEEWGETLTGVINAANTTNSIKQQNILSKKNTTMKFKLQFNNVLDKVGDSIRKIKP